MSELQPEESYVEEPEGVEPGEGTEAEELETEDSLGDPEDSESAPDSGENHGKSIEFSEEQQKIFNEALGKKVYKLREVERILAAKEKENEELRAKIPEQQRPDVPDVPDPFALSDEEYRKQLADREQALIQQAHYDAVQEAQRAEQQRLIEEQARLQQEAMMESVKTYATRAKQFGVSQEDLQVAGNTVAQFGINDDLVNYILQDDHGPLITKYLSQNLTELEGLSQMGTAQAAIRIATEIKDKAAALKPKVNTAPAPIDTPQGAGVAPKSKGPKGATFE